MSFDPVTTFDDLDGLDHDQMVEGYLSAEHGDPEPGENRGRSYWHGWRCRMMDYGYIVPDEGHALAGGGTLCLERTESNDLKASCISIEMYTFYANVKPCDISTTSTITIMPAPTSH
jgi:hypothetical protein